MEIMTTDVSFKDAWTLSALDVLVLKFLMDSIDYLNSVSIRHLIINATGVQYVLVGIPPII